ncbi:PaaI family thioesterase [Alisedimentitalea sp. MJ-SS2]|uniref:PaaI family thioesterase n=1 Tax=Aliisedimentitalea sp. MJ-SS2 TaxID=3049795 RepID=UPI00290E7DF4|nr:PaaI family thioesterase [Alisedimentitalea sp. MJ-SS2]MDU8928130.1 PaaI family thioesterase [Alisedimentitalea sp. MJ-SS2]
MDDSLREPPYPFQAHLGFTIDEWNQDYCRLSQPMVPHIGNRYGIPHGGVLATLLDTAAGYAVCYTGDRDNKQLVMTLSLNVQYHSVARGEMLIAEGRKTGGGKSVAFADAEITDENGTKIATATAVFKYRSGKGKP